nr:pyrimidine reductase [Gammaproteobacteria bacterium]
MRQDEREKPLLRILPGPSMHVPLQGLYLGEPLGPPLAAGRRFVYANFIASLDGRISLPAPSSDRLTVPAAIANPRDFRLFQELLASADVLITSGRYVRGLPRGVSSRSFPLSTKPRYADLHEWRRVRGLPPQPAVAIVTASLDLPSLGALAASGRRVYVATGNAADRRRAAALESEGAGVLRVGEGIRVQGRRLIEALSREGHRNIALIGGGEILRTLLVDGVLDRLYLTLACRVLGGATFDTLLTGPQLDPPARFELGALLYDEGAGGVDQLFAILDAKR